MVANFPIESPTSPLDIEKSTNETKEEYLTNNLINISVKIRNRSSFPLNNITIKEKTNNGLEIKTSINQFSISDPIEGIYYTNDVPKILYKKIDNNTIIIRKIFLNPKSEVNYFYTVEPKKRGFLDADTIIRIGGTSSNYADLHVPLELEVKPEFEVIPLMSKFQAHLKDSIKLSYEIIYKGSNPKKCNYYVQLDNRSNDFNCLSNSYTRTIFNKSEIKRFSPIIKFKEEGTHKLPGLLINDILYSPPNESQDMYIGPNLQEDKEGTDFWLQVLSIVVQLMSIAITFILGYCIREFKNIEKSLEKIRQEIHDLNIK